MAYVDMRPFASLEEAVKGIEIPEEIRNTLALISVPYFPQTEHFCEGQLVIHKDLADEVKWLFNSIYRMRFPIASIIPVSAFGWSDEASMLANNTSAFNIRLINDGSGRYSQHSYAWCIDINPMQNPCFDFRTNTSEPKRAEYAPSVPGTLVQDSPVVNLFRSYGWVWGGDWTSLNDYMHLEKRLDGKVS